MSEFVTTIRNYCESILEDREFNNLARNQRVVLIDENFKAEGPVKVIIDSLITHLNDHLLNADTGRYFISKKMELESHGFGVKTIESRGTDVVTASLIYKELTVLFG